jgi:cyanophycinase-like exopeptidase
MSEPVEHAGGGVGLLVIMGSGETAPTMVKPHREILTRTDGRPAVLIDTPYGFQENADDISSRAVGYFAASVGHRIEVVSWRTPPAVGLPRERTLAALRDAGWLFAGPGSPTYALRQWADTEIPEVLTGVLARDGVVVFASAAALTLGSHTVPVYEIYKAGLDPHWVPGLDLVRRVTGLPAVVIPHFDNAEGGHHDTRFCYLGERRLAALERELPDDAFVLGVDEHTAVLFDLAARTASVVGNGGLTVRRGGAVRTYKSGSVVSFTELASGSTSAHSVETIAPRPSTVEARPEVASSLLAEADEQVKLFDAALAARDVDGCVAAMLDLERALQDWSADTDVSDERDVSRAALRRMIVRLGELAVAGARDPRETVGAYVEALLELRRRAREGRDYATSDWIRDRLVEAGAEIHDTADGATWSL